METPTPERPRAALSPEQRAWRVSLGLLLLLLGTVALVAWRAPGSSGAWPVVLAGAGALSVAGLVGATALAASVALRPAPPDEVVVDVPASGAPTPRLRPSPVPASRLRAAVGLAAATAAPALLVVVLSAGAGAGAGADPGTGTRTGTGVATPVPSTDAARAPGATATPSAPSAPSASAAPPVPAAPPEPPAAPPPTGAAPVPPGAAAPPPTAGSPCRHVVVPGDTLWDLAARRLPAGSADAAVAAATQALHRANTATVGPDPDLILPGALLDTCP